VKITLKLFATLGDHLPPGSHENAAQIELPDDATPNQVIDRYGVPREMAHLVMVNGVYVDPAHRDDGCRLGDGDVLAVWPPVAGG
jgi:molybdopterin converting factor small subunit